MIHSVLAPLLFAFLISLYFCENVSAGVSRFGVLGGGNIANISSQPDDAFSSRTAVVIGGHYEYLVSPYIGLSPEFLIVGKGGKRGTDSVLLKLTYFEVPFLLKVHLGVSRVGVYLFGGPSIGFVIGSVGEATDASELSISNLYPNEMGVQLGAGLEFPLSKLVGFTFNLRYALGLNDISQAANNYKNNGIYALAGLTFRMEDEDQFTDTEDRAKKYLRNRYQSAPEEVPNVPNGLSP